MVCCILYYNNPINACIPKIQSTKGLISYFKTNGITNFQQTCECRPCHYCKFLKRRSIVHWKQIQRQLAKKRPNLFGENFINFFVNQYRLRKKKCICKRWRVKYILWFIVNCQCLGLEESFPCTYFGCVF
jgi:hypothetical protein